MDVSSGSPTDNTSQQLRFLYLYGVGAAIIIFINLLEYDNKLSEPAQECTNHLTGLREFFLRTAGSESNTVLAQVSKQCSSLIDSMTMLSWRTLHSNNSEERLRGIALVFREIGAMYPQAGQGNAAAGEINPFPLSLGTANPFDLDSFLLSRPASPTGMMFDWNEFLAGGTNLFFPDSEISKRDAVTDHRGALPSPRLATSYAGINASSSQQLYPR